MAEMKIASAAASRVAAGWLDQAWAEIHAQRLLIALMLGYIVAATVLPPLLAPDRPSSVDIYNMAFLKLAATFLVVVLFGYMIYVMIAVRPARLFAYYWTDLTSNHFTARRIAAILPMMVLTPWFFSAFTVFKSFIPVMRPYDLDPQFARWDAALHGGTAPWEWLQPIVGYPYVTTAISFVYIIWFFLLYGVLFWQIFGRRDQVLRLQFLLAFTLSWILLGTVAAILLSSAGPCYFGRITGLPDPFEPLMTYLRNADQISPVWALRVQEQLWENYQLKGEMPGGGISAMPSLHLATSTLLVLLGWRVDRRLGIALTIFCLMMLIGSVHLGWHYAIDGYVGIVGGASIWVISGWVARRMAAPRTAASRDV